MSEKQAEEFIREAKKKLNAWSLFGMSSSKDEDAAELYKKAADCYRRAKCFPEAANAFREAGNLFGRTDDWHSQYRAYEEEGKTYLKFDPHAAVKTFERVISIAENAGNSDMAARPYEMIADLYEDQLSDLSQAIKAHIKVFEVFDVSRTAMANKHLLKAARLSATAGRYTDAISMYEEVGRRKAKDELQKWSVKKDFMESTLCYLCNNDIKGAHSALGEYIMIDASFDRSREFEFAKDLTTCLEQSDLATFSDKTAKYDRLSKMTELEVKLCLAIKRHIQSEVNDGHFDEEEAHEDEDDDDDLR